VPFGTDAKETTEVVPAWCAKLLKTDSNDYLVYSIPDCDGGWMASSPAVHNLYVRSSDQALNGKLKPLIRFIKAWKYYLQVPISSFYLELRITHLFENANSIACYDLAVTAIFSFLYDTGLAKMQDPMGISGYVSPCSTYAKLEESESKLLTALVRAEKATEAKEDGNIKDAFFWWNRLYGDRFPSYYKSG
jgi:hypothetical protein